MMKTIALAAITAALLSAPAYAGSLSHSPSGRVPSGIPAGTGDNPDVPNCFIGFSKKYPGVKCETLDLQVINGNNGLTVGSTTCVKIKSATWDCRNNYH